jgi:lysozyme
MNKKRLKERIAKEESVELFPYKCPVGKLSIGVGRNIEERGISIQEADFLLENDVENVEIQLRESFPWFELLDDPRQEALADLCFNMGIRSLKTFKRMLKAMEEKRWSDAGRELMDSKYAKQVPTRAKFNKHLIINGAYAK